MSTNDGFNSKSFQTAARRRSKPLKFSVAHWVMDEETGEGHDVDVELMIDPNLDVIRIGTALGSLMGLDQLDQTSKLAVIEAHTPNLRAALREFVVPTHRERYDMVAAGLDFTTMTEIVRWVRSELSGLDPTQQESSSAGSEATGPTSTDGVEPMALTSA